MIYTEEIHATNLLNLLQRKFISDICATDYMAARYKEKLTLSDTNKCCKICNNFIGLQGTKCPCTRLGPPETRKLTWIALDEKGYL